MTVVKVQRPIYMGPGRYNRSDEGPWLIYDKFQARQSLHHELPLSMLRVFNSSPPNSTHFFKQYFDNAVWDTDTQTWDLTQCTPITRRLIW